MAMVNQQWPRDVQGRPAMAIGPYRGTRRCAGRYSAGHWSHITMFCGARNGTTDHVRTLTMGHKYGNFDVEDDK